MGARISVHLNLANGSAPNSRLCPGSILTMLRSGRGWLYMTLNKWFPPEFNGVVFPKKAPGQAHVALDHFLQGNPRPIQLCRFSIAFPNHPTRL